MEGELRFIPTPQFEPAWMGLWKAIPTTRLCYAYMRLGYLNNELSQLVEEIYECTRATTMWPDRFFYPLGEVPFIDLSRTPKLITSHSWYSFTRPQYKWPLGSFSMANSARSHSVGPTTIINSFSIVRQRELGPPYSLGEARGWPLLFTCTVRIMRYTGLRSNVLRVFLLLFNEGQPKCASFFRGSYIAVHLSRCNQNGWQESTFLY